MSAHAMSRAALTLPLAACTRTAYRVLILAAHVADTDDAGRSHAALDRAWIAQILGCPPITIQRAVRELVAAGLLVKTEPPRRLTGNRWQPTVYAVLPERQSHGSARE